MSESINDMLNELRDFAQARGWDEIVNIADELAAATPRTIGLAAPAGVDLWPFREWLERAIPDARITISRLESLAREPLPLLTAPRAIAIFPGDFALDAALAGTFESAFFARTPESYAVVLSEIERLQGEDDLALLERSAWRLFVPEPKTDWRGQSLSAHRVFLWSALAAGGDLGERLDRDRAALGAWVQRPADDPSWLARQTMSLLALAETRLAADARSVPAVAEPSGERLQAVREDLALLRRRLTGIVDREATMIGQELTVALQTLEQNLIRDLPAYLDRHIGPLADDFDDALLQRVLQHYLRSNLEQLLARLKSLSPEAQSDLAGDVEGLVAGTDWALVNQVLGQANAFPGRLLAVFQPSSNVNEVWGNGLGANTQFAPTRQSGVTTMVRMAIGGGLLMGISAITPFGLPGFALAGVLGAFGGNVVDRRIRRGELLRQCELYGREYVRHQSREATTNLQSVARSTAETLHRRVTGILLPVEEAFDARATAGSAPPAKAAEASPLAALQQRVLDSLTL